jgi:hypothetical protein
MRDGGGCRALYPVGPQVVPGRRTIGPCRTPWKGARLFNWPLGVTAAGSSVTLFTIEGYSTALDLLFLPNGNENLGTVAGIPPNVFALQAWGSVRGQTALIETFQLQDQATVNTPSRFTVAQCVARWDVVLFLNQSAVGLFPQPPVLSGFAGAAGNPMVSAIAHGREGG